jgi:hypothetical protein
MAAAVRPATAALYRLSILFVSSSHLRSLALFSFAFCEVSLPAFFELFTAIRRLVSTHTHSILIRDTINWYRDCLPSPRVGLSEP